MSDPLPEGHPDRWLGDVDPALMKSVTVELVGIAEIAAAFDVPRITASMWHVRRATSGFPEPVKKLAMGPVFDMADVLAWYTSKYPLRRDPV